MSQKPRTGAPARVAAASKVSPKEVATEPAPAKMAAVAKAGPVAKAEPVKVAKVEPVKVEPAIKAEPMVKAVPDVKADPMAKEVPFPKVEPVVSVALETKVSAPAPLTETIAAASGLSAMPTNVLSGTIRTAADTVAAVTAGVVETASAIKPAKPTLTPPLTQGMKTMMKSTEDFVAFGQANLEAFMKSGQIWSAGVQELTKQFATTAKASFEESVSTFKAISTAKSVKEAMELQSSFAKAALEKAMAESNKLTDASIKLTEQTLAPITARVTVAVETFGKAA